MQASTRAVPAGRCPDLMDSRDSKRSAVEQDRTIFSQADRFFSKKQSRFRYYSFPLQDVTSPTPITLERYFSKATGGGSPVFQMLLPKVSSEPIDLEGVSPRPAGLVTEWGGHIFHLVKEKRLSSICHVFPSVFVARASARIFMRRGQAYFFQLPCWMMSYDQPRASTMSSSLASSSSTPFGRVGLPGVSRFSCLPGATVHEE